MTGYDAVLFDLDGTLVDTEKGIVRAFLHTFRAMGRPMEEADIRRYLGPPLRNSFSEHFQGELVERAVEEYRAFYERYGLEGVAPFAGVPRMLEKLHRAGFVLAVATSKALPAARKVLDHFDLTQWFDVVGGASLDNTLDTKTAVMRYVLAQPALRGRHAVMAGDRANDMEGAADCGLDAVGAAYGYAAPGELEAFSPVFLAKSAQELGAWLLANQAEKENVR